MENVYIIDGIRTPIGKFTGSLSSVRADDLAAIVMRELMNRNSDIPAENLDDVIFGCANQAGEDNRNVARMALLLAGIPHTVSGETINRLCASGMSAVINGARAIKSGDAELILAGGVESMTRAPFVMAKADSPFSRTAEIYDTSIGWRFINPKLKERYGVDSMGETAENLAEMYNISREEQDIFADNSQKKATKSRESGRFASEIIPVEIPQKKGNPIIFENDEFIKPESSVQILSKLKPAFKKDGTVTAGNSSGINDGAASLLLCSESALKKYNREPKIRILSSASAGVEPRIMGIGPVEASAKALKKAGLTIDDMSIIELNEAFAAQSIACLREWGIANDDERLNPNGGAIALGHPLGMSGARLLITAMNELLLTRKKYALATMCIGVGQGYATILENVTI